MDEQQQPQGECCEQEAPCCEDGGEIRAANHGTLRAAPRNELRTEADVPMSSRKGIRDVNIKQLNYGYIVTIGCHNFAIETPEKLIEKLGEYVKSPQATEDKWFKGELL